MLFLSPLDKRRALCFLCKSYCCYYGSVLISNLIKMISIITTSIIVVTERHQPSSRIHTCFSSFFQLNFAGCQQQHRNYHSYTVNFPIRFEICQFGMHFKSHFHIDWILKNHHLGCLKPCGGNFFKLYLLLLTTTTIGNSFITEYILFE